MKEVLRVKQLHGHLVTNPCELTSQLQTITAQEPPIVLLCDRRIIAIDLSSKAISQLLNQEEIRRMLSLYQRADRERFLIGRYMLRSLLGCWHNQAPQSVAIKFGPYGKPFCPRGGPEFNLSHSGDLILLALHPFRKVGVDVERLHAVTDWKSMARILWPASIVENLERIPVAQQSAAFLEQWCKYEAQCKAIGKSLAFSSQQAGHHVPSQFWKLILPDAYLGILAMN